MTHKIFAAIPRRVITVVLIVFFAFLFFTVLSYPAWPTAVLCFIAGVGLMLVAAFHSEWRMKEAVTRLTDEIKTLATNFEKSEYSGITDETRPFYDALAHTKSVLEKKGHSRQELLEIVNAVAAQAEITKLLRNLLPKLNDATRSVCSAYYSINSSTNKLEIKHSVGFSKNIYSEFDINLGEGFIGQAATKHEITYYTDIPDDTVYFIRSFVGKIKPRSLVVVPVISQDAPAGVLVCASIYDYTKEDKDMIELIRHYVGVAVVNSANFERTKRLANELQFQNKLIQDQHEEMKNRLDEKTQWLNSMLRSVWNDAACAVDKRGTVLLWSDIAERVYGVSTKSAVGKPFERISDEAGWPSVAKALQGAVQLGNFGERFERTAAGGEHRAIDMSVRSVYDEQRAPLGVIISIKESE